jgi:hypothetical protein
VTHRNIRAPHQSNALFIFCFSGGGHNLLLIVRNMHVLLKILSSFLNARSPIYFRSGFRAFRQGDKRMSQMMMRGRIVAQAVTIGAMTLGTFYGLGTSSRPTNVEQTLMSTSSTPQPTPQKP